MQLVSDDIFVDNGAREPVYPAIYPELESDFELWNPNSWLRGHPYDLYKSMREDAPVMWSAMGRKAARFWSVSRYDDIKTVELNPNVFSSQRGGINIPVPPR